MEEDTATVTRQQTLQNPIVNSPFPNLKIIKKKEYL